MSDEEKMLLAQQVQAAVAAVSFYEGKFDGSTSFFLDTVTKKLIARFLESL